MKIISFLKFNIFSLFIFLLFFNSAFAQQSVDVSATVPSTSSTSTPTPMSTGIGGNYYSFPSPPTPIPTVNPPIPFITPLIVYPSIPTLKPIITPVISPSITKPPAYPPYSIEGSSLEQKEKLLLSVPFLTFREELKNISGFYNRIISFVNYYSPWTYMTLILLIVLLLLVLIINIKNMFKNFLLKKMLRTQGVPENQIDMVINMMEKNPELFKTIAEEIQEKMKQGKDQNAASMEVMQKYQDELKKIA